MNKRTYDVVVIGGGPAGMMASVSAAQQGAKVLLLEKGEVLGRKLMISGGGRCNVTNARELPELIENIPGNGRFLYSVFNLFNNRDIVRYFENLGIKLKEEDRGRMFPVSDKAKTVRDAMVNHMKELGVNIRLQSPVERLLFADGSVKGVRLISGEEITTKSVVIAAGGKSVPQSGSTGDAYPWAEEAGHTITPLFPSAVGLTSSDSWVKNNALQGLSLRNIEQTLYNPNGKKITSEEGDMIFTHFGISGPATFRSSRYVTPALKKFGCDTLKLTIDLYPQDSEQQLYERVEKEMEEEAGKTIKNLLKKWLPERMIPLMLEKVSVHPEINYHQLAKNALRQLVSLMKNFPVTINGTLPLQQATVTAGGVNVREIDPRTMQSKKMNGMFFAGEVMDVDAHTGGYNITVAFCTGYVAGYHAARMDTDQ